MLETFASKLVVFLIKPTLVVEYGNIGSIIRWEPTLPKKNDKTIPVDCALLAKNATGNSTFQIKTNYISLPSFLNPPRGSMYYFNYF